MKGLLLLGAGFLTALAVFAIGPDGNSYALATVPKHARLEDPNGPKIVFVGGSNLAFGLESGAIEQAFGRRVINMGMNGYLGVRFMLEEVRPHLTPGDIVVLSFEYDSFYKSAEGSAESLLVLVKAKPSLVRALTWSQLARVLGAVPYAAQQKTLRLLREGGDGIRSQLLAAMGRADEPEVQSGDQSFATISAVESASGFDAQGDLNSHVGVAWPWDREDGIDLTRTPIDTDSIELIERFAADMRGRGVDVVLSYTPAIRYFFDRHVASIERLDAMLRRRGDLLIPSPPQAFTYPEPLFFDTVYHLTEEGRARRTQRVIHDITTLLTSSGRRAHRSTLVH